MIKREARRTKVTRVLARKNNAGGTKGFRELLPKLLRSSKHNITISRKETFGPMPYEGMRAWDESRVPEKPDDWKHLEVFMSSYAGNVVSWQTHIPYKFINGEKRQFHSLAHRYWETTIQTLPDTWAVKYDERDGKIYFTLVGKAEICRGDFERAQEAAGGPPIFPNYEEEEVTSTEAPESESEDVDSNVELEKTSSGSFASIATTMILQVMMIALSLKQYL